LREAVVLVVPEVGARAGEGEPSTIRLVVLAVHEEALELLLYDEHVAEQKGQRGAPADAYRSA